MDRDWSISTIAVLLNLSHANLSFLSHKRREARWMKEKQMNRGYMAHSLISLALCLNRLKTNIVTSLKLIQRKRETELQTK